MQWQFYAFLIVPLALSIGLVVSGLLHRGTARKAIITIGAMGLVAWLVVIVRLIMALNTDM